ncbi:MAG: inorganic diphosphatase [Bacteroidota bacterium]
MNNTLITFGLALFLLTACQDRGGDYDQVKNPERVVTISDDHLNMIVEIPAGTNHKIEYDYGNEAFLNDKNADGSTRVINFLPYPGNYGFIPGTLMDTLRGGDGDALDVLVIAESAPTGSRIPVKPIAALLLRDRGEIDTKIIAVPADPTRQVLAAKDFLDFAINYDAARNIIESWFLNYKGPGQTELIRWEDENYAWDEVRKWKIDEEGK